ncbi:MAG TPA: hypothetical protein VN894_08915 [Polyangiaceae bacterium]|nr:hypothetical protein [Polyangiaceae bacterium]
MGQPKTIDFYRCLRPVQDRFVAATRLTTPPAPLLFRSASRPTAWILIGASAVLVVAATLVLIKGWGDISSPLALHRKAMLCVDVMLFSAAAYCFVHAAVVLRAVEALPYRAGTYVFPACVVDASGPVLRVWPLADADGFERLPQPALAVRMRDGARVVVPGRADEVERAVAALTSLGPALTRALAEDDVDMLAELDPLHQTRVSSPISSTEAMKPFSPMWMRFDWVLAISIGVTLGLGLGSMRNASSDERMYRTVVAAADISMYQKYLLRAGRHSDEVRDVLLARAELKQAQGQGTVEALQAYAGAHAGSKIGPEIDAAMRRALLVELDKAKAVGTVVALDEFVRKYPDNRLDAELKSARHTLYAQALAAWKKKAQVDAPTGAFIERLLASAEKNGAAVDVRFRYKPGKTLDEVDKRIAKHAYYSGPDALPSHYFTVDAMRPREQRVTQAVVSGFAAAFPADILAVRAGEPLGPDAPVPAGAPVLVVDYTGEWSNAMTASAKPRTVFAGIRFDFDARFLLPEGAPLQLSLKSWRGVDLWKIKGAMTLEDFHRKAYDAMIDHAFDDWRKRLSDAFFR